MVLQERKVVCPTCANSFKQTPRLSLLGFQKFHCPKCHHTVIHPLFQRGYYLIFLVTVACIALLALAGYSRSESGDRLLQWTALATVYVMDLRNWILIPLAAWAFLRLVGMQVQPLLPVARRILWWTGRIALAGLGIAVLGGVASLMIYTGAFWQTLLVALMLGGFLLVILGRDRLIRNRLRKH